MNNAMWENKLKFRKTKANRRMSESKRHYLMCFIFFVVAVAHLSSFLAWQNVKNLQLDVKITNLRKKERILYEKYYQQLLVYERLRQSVPIKNIAREKLKMNLTQHNDFLILKK